MPNNKRKPRMNIYDILFYSFYDVMSRQGNKNPNDDKFDGLFGGSIFFALVPFFFFMDFAIVLRHLNVFPNTLNKILTLGLLVLVMVFNVFYFNYKKRYLNIENEFKLMIEKKRRRYQFMTMTLVIVLIIGFFALMQLK
jgi:hypothetical protein